MSLNTEAVKDDFYATSAIQDWSDIVCPIHTVCFPHLAQTVMKANLRHIKESL